MRDGEKTKEKILTVAQDLFFSKGYDKTSMQDIMDAGGFTKGAIYHHFKSKKQIFDQIMYSVDNNGNLVERIISDQELNALQKLKKLIIVNVDNKEKTKMLLQASSLFRDYKVFGEIVNKNEAFIPMIGTLINEGNVDGSLDVKYPIEIAELYIQFVNIWIGTQLYGLTEERVASKVAFYQKVFEENGMKLLDTKIRKLILDYAKNFESKKKN